MNNMDAELNLELAKTAYPDDEQLRVAYMLGLEKGYEVCEEQMMKDAVEVIKEEYPDGTFIYSTKSFIADDMEERGIKSMNLNKVKAVFIKED